MKKFGKFLFGTLSLAAAAGGVYCLYKKRINKDADADFDDFDDEAGEDDDDKDFTVSADPEDREYVSITISSDEKAEETPADDTEAADDTQAAGDTQASGDAAANGYEEIDYDSDSIPRSIF